MFSAGEGRRKKEKGRRKTTEEGRKKKATPIASQPRNREASDGDTYN